MSYDPLPQTSTSKLSLSQEDDDFFLHDIPSTFDLALNGGTNNSPPSSYIPKAYPLLSHHSHSSPHPYTPPSSSKTWHTLVSFYHTNESLLRVALSQLFGALMNTTTRLLELEGGEDALQPFQILFLRQGLTMLVVTSWLWWKQIEGFPFGLSGVRRLLVARAMCGFWGIYGMYYSLQYLAVADATVITFLAPSVASYACYILFNEPFPRAAQYASLVAFLGVILIAQPFSSSSPSSSSPSTTETTTSDSTYPTPTTTQRLLAVFFALLGVLGAAGAYTSIRYIGTRAHPFISVNYFSTFCFLISSLVLTFSHPLSRLLSSPSSNPLPYVEFALPRTGTQWAEVLFLSICGLTMQYLLTTGLGGGGGKKGGGARATNMVYTQILFSLALDRIFWGAVPGDWSLVGGGLVLGSAVCVGVMKEGGEDDGVESRNVEEGRGEEEMAMLSSGEEIEGEVGTHERSGVGSST